LSNRLTHKAFAAFVIFGVISATLNNEVANHLPAIHAFIPLFAKTSTAAADSSSEIFKAFATGHKNFIASDISVIFVFAEVADLAKTSFTLEIFSALIQY